MEICVDSAQSALNAEHGGASRIELCSSLENGGVTPSIGLIQQVKEAVKIPVFVLIRPRSADFLYTDLEIEVMMKDIKVAKNYNVDGFVIGTLTSEGEIDVENTKRLINICRPAQVTFHRAIDMCKEPLKAVEVIAQLGCERILTSGQQPNAFQGRETIRQMNEKASNRLIIMPGGGVNSENLPQLMTETNCVEFHSSAKAEIDSKMSYRNPQVSMGAESDREYKHFQCDSTKVRQMVEICKQHRKT